MTTESTYFRPPYSMVFSRAVWEPDKLRRNLFNAKYICSHRVTVAHLAHHCHVLLSGADGNLKNQVFTLKRPAVVKHMLRHNLRWPWLKRLEALLKIRAWNKSPPLQAHYIECAEVTTASKILLLYVSARSSSGSSISLRIRGEMCALCTRKRVEISFAKKCWWSNSSDNSTCSPQAEFLQSVIYK